MTQKTSGSMVTRAIDIGMDTLPADDPEDLRTTRRTLSAAERELFGTRADSLGRYTLLGKLGNGSMGVVYRAFDPRLQRLVAVKILNSSGKGTAEAVSAGDTRVL